MFVHIMLMIDYIQEVKRMNGTLFGHYNIVRYDLPYDNQYKEIFGKNNADKNSTDFFDEY